MRVGRLRRAGWLLCLRRADDGEPAEYLCLARRVESRRGGSAYQYQSHQSSPRPIVSTFPARASVILGAECAEGFLYASDQLEPDERLVTGGMVQGTEPFDKMLSFSPPNPARQIRARTLIFTTRRSISIRAARQANPKVARLPHIRVDDDGGCAGCHEDDGKGPHACVAAHHSAGGACAVGAVPTVGGSVIIRRKALRREFFTDCGNIATPFQHIG